MRLAVAAFATVVGASQLSEWAIPLAALVVSAATFVLGQREIGRRAKVEYVRELETRIQECENDRTDLRRRLTEVQRENIDLLRRIVRLEGT